MEAVHRVERIAPAIEALQALVGESSVMVVPAPRHCRLEPTRRLMAAVLEAAIAELQQARRVNGRAWRARHERPDAATLRWFASRDRWWPYSFENICDGLGLDAGRIRRRLGVVAAV